MSCQSPYVLELSKASEQWNENGPLDEAKELLPRAIIVNCISSHVTYWCLGNDSGLLKWMMNLNKTNEAVLWKLGNSLWILLNIQDILSFLFLQYCWLAEKRSGEQVF